MMLQSSVFSIFLCFTFLPCPAQESDEDALRAKDERNIEVMMRIKTLDINKKEKYKRVVLRHLKRIKGTERYIEIIEHFKLTGLEDELLQLAIEKPTENVGVSAAKIVLKSDQKSRVAELIAGKDADVASALVKAIGATGTVESMNILRPMITSKETATSIRNSAVRAVAKSNRGSAYLLKLAKEKKVDKPIEFAVSDVLLSSRNRKVREEAAKFIKLPATAGAKPLPPIGELAAMKGDVKVGQQVFAKKGTCANCHIVKKKGKEVGPDLTEIGSKLSRQAMFVAILNPSEAISHNYENYVVELESGLTENGLLVSKTDEAVTIKNPEGIVKKFKSDEIYELYKDDKSVMPEGLQKEMSIQELVSLVDYLQTLKKK